MKKFDVIAALNQVREARKKWDTARAKYKADETALMRRLAMEGAVNYMSPEEIADESGLTLRGVRLILRGDGLDPRRSKAVLSKHAARTLADNAALMGIEPRDFDLTSPLAYLPMGSNLKQFLGASVTAEDISDETKPLPVPLQELVGDFQVAWLGADKRGEEGARTEAGLLSVLAKLGYTL